MISQLILILCLAGKALSVKNGDYMEFYVSGEDLPSNNGDCDSLGNCTPTGRFGYLWMSGKKTKGLSLLTIVSFPFDYDIESELIKSNSPSWINDTRNITVINTADLWSRQRMFVYEEGVNPDGDLITGYIAGIYDMSDYDLEENVAKSCGTKVPFNISVPGWSEKSRTVTLLFHCTKFVPK